MRHSPPSCHLPLIQCFHWTCCALLPPIHKLFIVNANSIAGNLAFVLVVLEQECSKLALPLDNSYNKITIQICNCRSSCLVVCRFPERQILTPLLISPFFSPPSSLSHSCHMVPPPALPHLLCSSEPPSFSFSSVTQQKITSF